MTKKLLLKLNGTKNGSFIEWLNNFEGEPRISWYPSAGEDFRDLLYLNSRYYNHNPSDGLEPFPPNIFLHTDYFPWETSSFLDSHTVYSDRRTCIRLKEIEKLPELKLPLDEKIVFFPEGSVATNHVVFIKAEVNSSVLGTFIVPVVYAFVENASFCSDVIIPNNCPISHIIHVRYGGGCGGGGYSTGSWLLNVLQKLECECFITDGCLQRASGDERVYELFPNLRGSEDISKLKPIREMPSYIWSEHGDITWNIID